jgi:hypothetical protein
VASVTFVGPLSARVTLDPPPPADATRVTARLCEAEGSATLVAVIVTFEDDGALAGAV